MFKITYHEKILLGKLVDAYYMANLSDAQPDGKDFWMDLSDELCATVCRPLEQAMMAILKAYDYSDFSNWVACGMPMDAVEVFADPDDDLDPIQGIKLPNNNNQKGD
jgi:hypothetical protein|tara:strand:+ start:141 stop:461 length:321 start_codon:yes stop_codon:yes gene_type:complete